MCVLCAAAASPAPTAAPVARFAAAATAAVSARAAIAAIAARTAGSIGTSASGIGYASDCAQAHAAQLSCRACVCASRNVARANGTHPELCVHDPAHGLPLRAADVPLPAPRAKQHQHKCACPAASEHCVSTFAAGSACARVNARLVPLTEEKASGKRSATSTFSARASERRWRRVSHRRVATSAVLRQACALGCPAPLATRATAQPRATRRSPPVRCSGRLRKPSSAAQHTGARTVPPGNSHLPPWLLPAGRCASSTRPVSSSSATADTRSVKGGAAGSAAETVARPRAARLHASRHVARSAPADDASLSGGCGAASATAAAAHPVRR